MGRYRKTSHRQRRHPLSWSPGPQRRHSIAWPVLPAGDVVLLLPGRLSLIAPGRHGAVVMTPAGLVQIAGRSREQVVQLGADFFASVARAIVAGHTIVARCAMEPAIIASCLRWGDR